MDSNARAHAAQRAAGLGRNNRRAGRIHRLTHRPQLRPVTERGRAQRMPMRERARTRLIWRQVRSVGWAVHVARERQFCAPGLSALPMLTARSQPHSAGCTRCEQDVPADKCRRRHVARPWPGGRSTADGVAAVGPENLSATLADDRGMFRHGPCEGASPEDLLDSRHGHGVEIDPAGGQLPWRQHGTSRRPVRARRSGRSPSRQLPGDTLLAQNGARRFPAEARAGSTCSPAIGWHRFSELQRRHVAAANRAGG